MNSRRSETAGLNPRCRNGGCLYQDRCLRIDACHGNALAFISRGEAERMLDRDVQRSVTAYNMPLKNSDVPLFSAPSSAIRGDKSSSVRDSVIDECIADLDGYAFMASKPIETGVLRSIDRLRDLKIVREPLSEKESLLRTESAVAWAVFDVASEELIDVTAIRPDDRPGIEVKPLGWLDNGG